MVFVKVGLTEITRSTATEIGDCKVGGGAAKFSHWVTAIEACCFFFRNAFIL